MSRFFHKFTPDNFLKFYYTSIPVVYVGTMVSYDSSGIVDSPWFPVFMAVCWPVMLPLIPPLLLDDYRWKKRMRENREDQKKYDRKIILKSTNPMQGE